MRLVVIGSGALGLAAAYGAATEGQQAGYRGTGKWNTTMVALL